MKCFGLAPHKVLQRSTFNAAPSQPTLSHSIRYGSLSFGLVSLLAYSIWAFRLIPGAGPMYGSIAFVYIALSGLALGRLNLAPKAGLRFAALFAVGFILYAALWCVFWFGLKGKHNADLWGSFFGLAALVFLFQRAFELRSGFLPLLSVLFTFHTVGYFIGEELHAAFSGQTGKLLWGAAHGLGFGAGLGNLMFHCQKPLLDALEKPDAPH